MLAVTRMPILVRGECMGGGSGVSQVHELQRCLFKSDGQRGGHIQESSPVRLLRGPYRVTLPDNLTPFSVRD